MTQYVKFAVLYGHREEVSRLNLLMLANRVELKIVDYMQWHMQPHYVMVKCLT